MYKRRLTFLFFCGFFLILFSTTKMRDVVFCFRASRLSEIEPDPSSKPMNTTVTIVSTTAAKEASLASLASLGIEASSEESLAHEAAPSTPVAANRSVDVDTLPTDSSEEKMAPPAPKISRRRKVLVELVSKMTKDEKERYLVHFNGGVVRSPFPMVRLEFEPMDNELFRHFQFRDPEKFSSEFADWFDLTANLTTTFLEETWTDENSFEILKGERDGDVTFFDSERLTEEQQRERQTMNEHAGWHDLQKTKQKITLLHWVTNDVDIAKWMEVKTGRILECRQWLDTHAHPGWCYTLAAQYEEKKVLLRICIPKQTVAIRVPRFEVSQTLADFSPIGTWIHNDKDLGFEEVRLPPGTFEVTKVYPELKYDGTSVVVVELMYLQSA